MEQVFTIQDSAESWLGSAVVLAVGVGSLWLACYCLVKAPKWRLVGVLTPVLAAWLAWQVFFVVDPVMSITARDQDVIINRLRSHVTLQRGEVTSMMEIDRGDRYNPRRKGLRFVTRSGQEYETPAIDTGIEEIQRIVARSLGLLSLPSKDGFRRWEFSSSSQ